jgi:hypothetical protein
MAAMPLSTRNLLFNPPITPAPSRVEHVHMVQGRARLYRKPPLISNLVTLPCSPVGGVVSGIRIDRILGETVGDWRDAPRQAACAAQGLESRLARTPRLLGLYMTWADTVSVNLGKPRTIRWELADFGGVLDLVREIGGGQGCAAAARARAALGAKKA